MQLHSHNNQQPGYSQGWFDGYSCGLQTADPLYPYFYGVMTGLAIAGGTWLFMGVK